MDIETKKKKLNRMKMHTIFFKQIQKIKEFGCTKKNIEDLIKKYHKVLDELEEIELTKSMEPFVLVVPSICLTKRSLVKLRKEIKGISDPKTQKMIESENEESSPYFIIGVEKGVENSGLSCFKAKEHIKSKNGKDINAQEMIAIAIQTNAMEMNLLHCTKNFYDNLAFNIAKQDKKFILYLSTIYSSCEDWGTPYYLKKI